MSGASSIPGNPGMLYRQFKANGGNYTDFGLPAGMGNTGAIVANIVQPKKEGDSPTVEFRFAAPTGMTSPSDTLSVAEIRRRVQMTASILEPEQQAQ